MYFYDKNALENAILINGHKNQVPFPMGIWTPSDTRFIEHTPLIILAAARLVQLFLQGWYLISPYDTMYHPTSTKNHSIPWENMDPSNSYIGPTRPTTLNDVTIASAILAKYMSVTITQTNFTDRQTMMLDLLQEPISLHWCCCGAADNNNNNINNFSMLKAVLWQAWFRWPLSISSSTCSGHNLFGTKAFS